MYDNVHLIHLLQTNAVTRKVSISFLGSCYPSRHSEYPTTVTPGYLLVPGGHCHQACVFYSTSSSCLNWSPTGTSLSMGGSWCYMLRMLGKVLVTLSEELITEYITVAKFWTPVAKFGNSLVSPARRIPNLLLFGFNICYNWYSYWYIMEWLLSYSGYLPLGNKSDFLCISVYWDTSSYGTLAVSTLRMWFAVFLLDAKNSVISWRLARVGWACLFPFVWVSASWGRYWLAIHFVGGFWLAWGAVLLCGVCRSA